MWQLPFDVALIEKGKNAGKRGIMGKIKWKIMDGYWR